MVSDCPSRVDTIQGHVHHASCAIFRFEHIYQVTFLLTMASVTIEAGLQPSIFIVEWLFVACITFINFTKLGVAMLGKTLQTLQLTIFTLSSEISQIRTE